MTVHRRGVFSVAALCEALEKRRLDAGISGRELARQAGVVEAAMMTHLRQGVMPSAETLARLMLWLGTTNIAPFLTPPAAGQHSGEVPNV